MLLLLTACLTAACVAVPRKAAPPELIAMVHPPGFPPTGRFLSNDRDDFVAHANQALQGVRAAARGRRVNILALSGGGAGGAFGAGALVGLSQRGDRPVFDLVTGVSAGALIAPFAYLGPAWDVQLKDAFGGHRTEHLLQRRALALLLFRPGFFKRNRPVLAP